MPATLVRDLRANLSLGMSDEEFQRGMAGLKAKAPAQGEQVAGAFSKAFSRQLGQAFRSLPQAQITADTSEADLKVNVLRQSLRDLANKRIGVDIDAATALAEMRAIKGELEGLKDTATIDVKADIAKSLAALGVVERQVEKLDGKDVDIDVNVDVKGAAAAAAEVGVLESALSALRLSGTLGPAAVGGAIAALPAIAAAAGAAVTFTLGSALAGVGLAASQGSAAAQAAIARLKAAVQAEAQEVGRPFERVWTTIVDVAQREMDKIGPTVRDALADLAPTVQDFASDAGSSLEELTPAVDSIERAFKAVLESLGPALPDIMHNLSDGITAITDAVERNPEALTRMAQSLAGFAEWAGKATGKLIDFANVLQEHAELVQNFFGVLSLPTQALKEMGIGMVDVGQSAEQMTSATLSTADGVSVLDQRISGLITAFGLVGSEGADAATQLMASWSQTFQQMTSVSSVMQQVQARTQATIATQQRQAAAQQQLADAQANGAERISQAQDRLADTQERAAERIEQADRQVVDTKRRAADQIEAANDRVASSREAVAEAEESAAERVADAEQRVEDARRRAADAAESAGARIEDAVQRVADAEQAAADHEVDAERRVRVAHERTLQAVEDLTQARKRAQEQLEDLAASQASAGLDEEAAQLALERARQRASQLGPDSSDLDRREADLAVRQAVARLDEVKRRNAELRQQIAEATKAGVEGAAEVVQATQRVAAARQAEQDAEAAAAKQRLDDIRAIRDAEKALAEAQRDAARQQEDAQRALAEAEAEVNRARVAGAQDVAEAKKALAEAEAAAAKTSVDAARQVRDAQEDARKAHREAARDIQDAEAAVTKARQDSAQAIERASQAVKEAMSGVGGAAHVTTEQFLAELERQVKNTEEWAANLTKLAGRVPAEMVDKLAALGPGAADVVAMAAGMTDKELKKFIELMGRSGKASGDQFSHNMTDAINANPQNVKVGLDDARARVAFNQLIHDIGTAANVAISVTVGAALQATGHSADGNIYMANGGVLSFASGTERHVAQLAMPGTRVWSEPETGGEAYIPLGQSKRERSEAILAQVAERFGGAFVKHQAAASIPVMGGDGASGGWGGGISIGQITLAFADDRDMYAKGQEFAAGLREYVRYGGVLPS